MAADGYWEEPLDHPAAGPRRERIRSCRPPGDFRRNSTWEGSTRKPPPAPRAGNNGSAGVAAQPTRNLHLQDRPAGDDAALAGGGRAEAGRYPRPEHPHRL